MPIATLLLAAVSLIIPAQVFAQEADDLPPPDVYHERGRSTDDRIALCALKATADVELYAADRVPLEVSTFDLVVGGRS